MLFKLVLFADTETVNLYHNCVSKDKEVKFAQTIISDIYITLTYPLGLSVLMCVWTHVIDS